MKGNFLNEIENEKLIPKYYCNSNLTASTAKNYSTKVFKAKLPISSNSVEVDFQYLSFWKLHTTNQQYPHCLNANLPLTLGSI